MSSSVSASPVGSFAQLTLSYLALLMCLNIPASADPSPLPPQGVASQPFGQTAKHEPITLYTLTNKNGMTVSIMNYGATIVNIIVPDRNGKMGDVALGFDHFAPYVRATAYFGAVVGRYGNRIAKGQFELAGKIYHLPINNGPNSLHGGLHGFDKYVWKEEAVDSDSPAVRFSMLSPDGDQGYPGNLFVSVTYTLDDENALHIAYQATTDQPTVINLTNHSYFNLAGAGSGTILDQVITLHADHYLPVDATQIPTGEIKAVAGTPWDFLQPTKIGLHLKETGARPLGYDHNFVLNKGFFSKYALAAEVEDPVSGRTMKVYTDQPGVQFYTGNFLDGTITGKDGKVYRQHDAFCLETQHFPDSPNHSNFPSTVLQPGDTYETSTVYQFGTK
jgi:aldose 1-epimerase